MGITKNLAARALIWLAAISVPVQSLPAASCGCVSGKSYRPQGEQSTGCCGGESHKPAAKAQRGCCQHQTAVACPDTGERVGHRVKQSPCRATLKTCCASHAVRASCCSTNSANSCSSVACQCGKSCQCSANKAPAKPVPPVENNSNQLEKVASDAASAVCYATVYKPQDTRYSFDALGTETNVLAALDCCIHLCRFTL